MQTMRVRAEQLANIATASIPSNYSRIIGRELMLQAREIPKLLRLTQLSSNQFMQEDILLTAQQQIQILYNALHLSDHMNFGLRLGLRLTPSTHGAMGFLANSSPNLLMALEAFQAFLPTRISFVRLILHCREDAVTCFISFEVDLHPDIKRVISETIAVVFYECAGFIVGRPVIEGCVAFTHKEPSYSSCYSDYLPGSYSFTAPNFMLSLPMSVCQIPNASANHDSYAFALQKCQAMLAQLKQNKHASTYDIQKAILSHPLGELSEEDAAATLFISKRTLARRLAKEGTSFRQVRDKILSEQACSYLDHNGMSIATIAALLNYHDSANFRRAFKRWFNMSPSDYRKQASKVV